MIRYLLFGMARLLFLTAVAIAGLALLVAYCSVRLVKAATVGRQPMPVRDAGYATLVALVALVQALRAQQEHGAPVED